MTSTGYRPLSQSAGKPGERPGTGVSTLHIGERPVGSSDPIIGRRPITGGSAGHIGRRPTTSIGSPSWILAGASLDIYPAAGLYYDGSVTTFAAIATTTHSAGAYSWDSTGKFTQFAASTPRITDLGLLMENATVQMVQQNTNLGSGTWTKNNLTPTTGQTSPDPANATANSLNNGAATGVHNAASQNASFVSGTTYVSSVYFKAGTDFRLQVALPSGQFGATAFANFNLSSVAVTLTGAAITASGIIPLALPGWYRLYIAAPATASTSGAAITLTRIPADNSVRSVSYAGDSTTVTTWLPGTEIGNYPSSPIQNANSATLARAVDNIQITGGAATAAVYAALSAYSDTNYMHFGSGANVVCNINAALLQATSTTIMEISNGTDVADCTIGFGGTIASDVQTSYGFDGVNLTSVANDGIQATTPATWGATSGTIQLGNRIALDRSTQGFIRRIAFSPIASNFDVSSPAFFNIYEGDYFEIPAGIISQNDPLDPTSGKQIPADVVYTVGSGYESTSFTIPLLAGGNFAGSSTNVLRLPSQTYSTAATSANIYTASVNGISTSTGAVTNQLFTVRVNKLTVGTTKRYIGPSALGTGDGSSAANQSAPSGLSTMLQQAGPGGTVYVFADQGTYPNNSFNGTTLKHGGGPGSGVTTLAGVNAALVATNVPIISNRTTFTPPGDPHNPTSVVGWTTGGAMFNMGNQANNIKFLNWAPTNGGSFIHATGSFHGLILDTHNAFNFQRYFEQDHQTVIGNPIFRDVTVNGYSKQAFRCRGASHDVTYLRVLADSMRQDGDNFAVGYEISDFAHDIAFNNCTGNNSYSSVGSFKNGDGASSENTNNKVAFTDSSFNDNMDGGIDCKAENVTVVRVNNARNRANFKVWYYPINFDTITSDSPTNNLVPPGSLGGSLTHVDAQAADFIVTKYFYNAGCSFTDTDPTTLVFQAENDKGPQCAVHFHVNPAATISVANPVHLSSGGSTLGSTLDDFTTDPPVDIIAINNPGIVASGDYTFSEPATSTLPAPQYPAAGDLMHVTIGYRDVANFTLPVGWTLCGTPETSGNTTNGGISSLMMASCIRGSTAPNMTFTRTGGGKAEGTLRIYRKYDGTTLTLDAYSSSTQASATTTPVCPGLTTSAANALIIMGVSCPRDTGVTAFSAATDPATASGSTSAWDYPYPGKVFARTNITSTGATQVSISTFDAIRATAGATGQFSGTAGATGRQAVCVVAFK